MAMNRNLNHQQDPLTKAILEKWVHFNEIYRVSSGSLQLIVGLEVISLQLFPGEDYKSRKRYPVQIASKRFKSATEAN